MTNHSTNEERRCTTIHWIERELSVCHFLLTELSRQMTLPTENGHAAPPVESRESCQFVNPDYFDFWKGAEGVIKQTIPLGKSPAWWCGEAVLCCVCEPFALPWEWFVVVVCVRVWLLWLWLWLWYSFVCDCYGYGCGCGCCLWWLLWCLLLHVWHVNFASVHHALYWTVVVRVETIPLCQRLVFATGLQRPRSFPDTSGTRKIQKTASANDCFNVLDKCGFVFPVASFQNSLVFRRGW